MMGLIHVAVALLGLLSSGQAAPVTNCENITQRIEIQGRDQLSGVWIYLADSTNITGFAMLAKQFVESVWVKITPAKESDALDFFHSQKMFGSCFVLRSKVTLINSTLIMDKPIPESDILLTTGCADCLVVYSQFVFGGQNFVGLQLLSRRNKVTDEELQEFVKQTECLNLPAPTVLDPKKGLCPDNSLSQEKQAFDLTNIMDEVGPGML